MVAMERPSSLVPRKPRLPPLEATGEKPLFFFAVVALLNIVDAFNLNIVWPMLPFMVESFGVAKSEADLGAWVGAAGAAVSVGQLMSSYAWGALSDRIGRRPVLLMGMFNSTFSVLVFGTATTYTQVRVYEGLHFQIPRLFGPTVCSYTLRKTDTLLLLLHQRPGTGEKFRGPRGWRLGF